MRLKFQKVIGNIEIQQGGLQIRMESSPLRQVLQKLEYFNKVLLILFVTR